MGDGHPWPGGVRTLHPVTDAVAPDEEPDGEAAGDEVLTGEPDAAMVDEAVTAAVADPDETADPDGTADPETAAPETAAPRPTATDGPADADAVDPAVERIEAALATVQAGVDGVHTGVEGLQVGLDSTLADLAATAREESLGTGLAGLQTSLDELVRLTRRADDHVAELHSENQRLRAGELASVTLPLLRDVVRLHDEVDQLSSAAAPEAQDDLALVRSRLLDTLARWGLTAYSPAPGDALDATRHNGVGAVASSDGEPGTVATVRRVGFAHDDGRTFRAADVEVHRPPPPPPVPTPETED